MSASDESVEGLDGEADKEESNSIHCTWSEFFDSGREDTLELDIDVDASDADGVAL